MKKAIIIGASSGIGRELALLLAKGGYQVGLTGRRNNLLEELKIENPESFCLRSFDVGNTKQSIEKLEELVVELKGLDLVIICSGTGNINKSLNFEMEEETIATNVIGFTCVADWAYNYFEKQGFGHLVGISSIGGLRGSGLAPSYNASKAYQINYLEGLRQKASKGKVPLHVTDIRPGLVDTAMAKGEGLFWVMPLKKTALQIHRAIMHKKKVAYVSKRWGFIAAVLKIIPGWIYNKM
jgi:short-subunit dehydrogenase